MIRRPPRSTRTDTLLPCTTLFRSPRIAAASVRMSSIVTQSLPLPLVKRSRGGEHRCIVPGALGGAREVGKARLAAEIVEIGVDSRALEPGGADRKSGGEGKSVSVSVDLGGRRNTKKKKQK